MNPSPFAEMVRSIRVFWEAVQARTQGEAPVTVRLRLEVRQGDVLLGRLRVLQRPNQPLRVYETPIRSPQPPALPEASTDDFTPLEALHLLQVFGDPEHRAMLEKEPYKSIAAALERGELPNIPSAEAERIDEQL